MANARATIINKDGAREYFNGKGIRLQADYIEASNFPFGTEIESAVTDLQLNEKRVAAMGMIMQKRTLQKMPGNSHHAIERTMMEFCSYVKRFSNVTPESQEVIAQKGTSF